LAWIDLFRDPVLWRQVERGVALQLVYAVVFLGLAWANLGSKDITS
jgi:ABC-2 type transport system permease protein